MNPLLRSAPWLAALLAAALVTPVFATEVVWQASLQQNDLRRVAVLEGIWPGSADAFVVTGGGAVNQAQQIEHYRMRPGGSTVVLETFVDPDRGPNERFFGFEILNGGDVDGDGFDDLWVTAAGGSDRDGAAYLYLGGPAFDTTHDFAIRRTAAEAPYFAVGACGGGDLNGDGYDDLALRVKRGDVFGTEIYFGGPLLDDVADAWLPGTEVRSSDATRGSMRDDLDGDGFDDLVTTTGSTGTELHVFLGGPDFDATVDHVVTPYENVVVSLTTGDADGDGRADLLAVTVPGAKVHRGGPDFDGVEDMVVPHPELGPGSVQVYRRITLFQRRPGEAASLFHVPFYDRAISLWTLDPATLGQRLWTAPYPNTLPLVSDEAVQTVSTGTDVDADGRGEFVFVHGDRLWMVEDPFLDCNEDGLDDVPQIDAGLLDDCDGDGMADACQVVEFAEDQDCNADGTLDQCQLDTLDCDDNGKIDSCEIADAWDGRLDCDSNGVLDVCQPVSSTFDQNDNGIPDCREIAETPSLDCNGNGTLDELEVDDVNLDCDGNGTRDVCESRFPSVDCNADYVPDTCQVESFVYDCDLDGTLDVCGDDPDRSVDCDQNEQGDLCELLADPSLDCDGDGFLDACSGTTPALPCASRPYVAVYFDAAHTVTARDGGQIGNFQDLYVVLRNVDPERAASITRFEFRLTLPVNFLPIETELPTTQAVDLQNDSGDWYVLVSGPLAVDAQGDLQLVRIRCFVNGAVAGPHEIAVRGSSISPLTTQFPVFEDGTTGEHRVLDTRSAWIDPDFVDCDANGQPDTADVMAGRATDSDGNGVLDSCEATATPSPRTKIALSPAVPNPFNPRTTLAFTIGRDGPVELVIFDATGRRTRTLVRETLPAGTHERIWNGTDDQGANVASGVYFVRLVTPDGARTQKTVLLR